MLAHAAPLLLLVWKGQKSTKSSPDFGALRAMLSEEQVQTEATFLHGQGAVPARTRATTTPWHPSRAILPSMRTHHLTSHSH